MLGVAVVADELIAGASGQAGQEPECPQAGFQPRSRASRPADIPAGLCRAFGGDEVERGAVAVGVVAGFARGGHAQLVAAQHPDRAGVQAGVDERGAAAGGDRPAGSGRNARGWVTRWAAVRLTGPVSAPRRAEHAARIEEPGEASCSGGWSAYGSGAGENVVDLGGGVVVAKDRLAQVAVGARSSSRMYRAAEGLASLGS